MTGVLRTPRRAALMVIAALVAAASLVSFAESYRGLYDWAREHGLSGAWAAIWPLQVDVFIAVGELALFVALVDAWARRSRAAAWAVTLAGLAVSVAGNVGHVAGHSLAARVTAAVPPLAAAAALAVGLGVLKRVVEGHHAGSLPMVAADAQSAALAALRATTAAGNPLSGRQLETRFGLSRADVSRVRELAMPERPCVGPEPRGPGPATGAQGEPREGDGHGTGKRQRRVTQRRQGPAGRPDPARVHPQAGDGEVGRQDQPRRAKVERHKAAVADRGRDGGGLPSVPATPEPSMNGHADGA